MTTEAFWQAVLGQLDAGEPVFVALVVANTRGSPGTIGARMMVGADGGTLGTIGGGIMETNVVAAARRQLGARTPMPPVLEQLVHRKKPGVAHPSGLICAGEQTNLEMVLEPAREAETIRRFVDAIAAQEDVAATLVVDAQGVRLVEGGRMDAVPGMTLRRDDDRWEYREDNINPQRLAIVGGGHCGKALARLAVEVGYRVQVLDTRPDVFEGEDWPREASRRVLDDYGHLATYLRHPGLTSVVVMTTAVTHDIAALAAVATLPLRWLGVMGSAAKIHEIRTQLGQHGIGAARIDAIHGPIGLPMKSDTPPEIAVSVMAQLLVDRRAR